MMWRMNEEPDRGDVQHQLDALRNRVDRNDGRIGRLQEDALIERELVEELQAEGLIDRAQIGQLETALTTARRIGAAMGILMATYQCTQAEAFARLSRASQESNRKLRDLADDVIQTGALR